MSSSGARFDGRALIGAVKHPTNFKPIIFCSLSLVAVGMLMTVFGLIVMLVDHTELGPPVFDTQYERYQGSSMAHILGPMFIGFGSLVIFGNIIMLAYATRSYYKSNTTEQPDNRRTLAKHRHHEIV